jgi:hypothetical protein
VDGGGRRDDGGGLAVLFFWIQNQMFERFTPKIVFHSFTPVLHIFTMYDFYLTIYRANGYLSVARNDSHNLGWLMFWKTGGGGTAGALDRLFFYFRNLMFERFNILPPRFSI